MPLTLPMLTRGLSALLLATPLMQPIAAAQTGTRPLSTRTTPGNRVRQNAVPASESRDDSQESDAAASPLTIKTYRIDTLEADSVEATIRKLGLSAVAEKDGTANRLIVQATAAEHATIAQLLRAMLSPQRLPLTTPPAARLSLYGLSAPAEDRWIHSLLEQPCPPLRFPGETPLYQILTTLFHDTLNRAPWAVDEARQLQVLPDYGVLELQGVDSFEDVVVTDMEISGGTVESALETALQLTSEPQLAYQVLYGKVIITTEAKVRQSRSIRCYDISGVLAPAAGITPASLIAMIHEETRRFGSWKPAVDDSAGLICFVGDRMVVHSNANCHRAIVMLLHQLWHLHPARVESPRTSRPPADGAHPHEHRSRPERPQQSEAPAFARYAESATEQEKRLHDLMEQPCPELDFPGDTPLTEILGTLADAISSTPGTPPVPVVVDHAELSEEGVDSLEDVVIRDLQLRNITLEHALDLIMEQTAEPELSYVIRKDVLLITTDWAMQQEYLLTRTYHVGSLLKLEYGVGKTERQPAGAVCPDGNDEPRPAAPPASGGGLFSVSPQLLGQSHSEWVPPARHPLCELIMTMTSPPSLWQDWDGEGGAIRRVGDTIVVRQSYLAHREIVRLLNQLAGSATTSRP